MSSSYPNKRRPYGPPAIWATDATMTAPSMPYDGAATKTRPSDGLTAAGFLVDERPPADRWNWKWNDQDRRHASIDLIEARTFVEPGTPDAGNTTAGTGSTVGWFAGARWGQFDVIYHATNSTAVERSVNGGYTWSTVFNVPSAVFSGICTRETALKAGGTAASYTLTGVAKIALTGGDPVTNNAWASTTLTGSGASNSAACIVADPYVSDVFLVGGNDFITATTTPVVWRVTAPLGAFGATVKVTMGSPVAFFYPMRCVVAGPTYKLAAGWSGATNGLFRWQDGNTTATAVTSPTASEIVDLLWLPEDERFLLIAKASPGVEFWTSVDGATGTWTQIDTTVGGTSLFVTATPWLRGACVRGSIIMVPIFTTGPVGHIAVSGDGGATWEIIADPMVRHDPAAVVQRCADLGARFIAAAYKGGGAVSWTQTLRAG